ncbi:MAG: RNA polymerase subunit sigma-70 [Lachnospiraceae bacterium]|nr:RNA polymerase subunit sigma-70 [Lachnospiraceae bacterium]
MTTDTRDQILQLRNEGMGYQAIANAVGEKRDAVRYICKSRGLGGKATEKMISDGRICKNCGIEITQPPGKGRRRRFCSEACRRSWWKKHPEEGRKLDKALYQGTCACCGKEFTAYGNNHRTYCSRECFIKARFWT